ncbi:MAG: DUF2076 domain-containing protein, partial [Phreatobacter sp.]
MNQQERDIIAGLFDRLKSAESQQRDPAVDTFIKERLVQQPGAVYALLQTMYVSDQALNDLSKQNEQLQGQVASLQGQVDQMQQQLQYAQRQAEQQQSGGFLSSIFGSKPAAPPPMPPRPLNTGMAPPPPGFGQPQGGPPQGYGAPPQGQYGAPPPGQFGGPPQGGFGAPQPGGPWGRPMGA